MVIFLHKKAIYIFDYRCIKVFLERYAKLANWLLLGRRNMWLSLWM